MPLDTIYLTRHGHRLSWTIDHKTGTYHSNFPTPTGNPADPTLTAHGVRQSHELAAYFVSDDFAGPRPWRIYSSPFYRCLQTIQPTVEALDRNDTRLTLNPDRKEKGVRIENGLGEWFGASTYFDHPSPSSMADLHAHFPSIVPDPKTTTIKTVNSAHVIPSTRGETIPQLHNRVATTLAAIIADADADIRAEEERDGNKTPTSKAIVICSHAATLIAMGRCLTGNMPDDYNVDDFHVYTAGLSTFRRRRREAAHQFHTHETGRALIAQGTKLCPKSEVRVPIWEGGKGVGGGWDCVKNCDCSFLSGGEERGWHFNGEESFDTGPMTGNEPAKL